MGSILKIVFFFGVGIVYIFDSVKGMLRVLSSEILSTGSKFFHTIFLWFLPFLWHYIIKDIIRVEKPITVTKKLRDQRKKDNENPFYDGGFYA